MESDAIMSKKLMQDIMQWYVVVSFSADVQTIAMMGTEDMTDVKPELIGRIYPAGEK